MGFLMSNFPRAILLAVVFWKEYVGIKYCGVIYRWGYLRAGLFTGQVKYFQVELILLPTSITGEIMILGTLGN